ncbi:aldehyde dehydrogenase family protein [Ochrovirga pacifica]|uniref:aldehyde dehydrogenase family protein n=1 Tax=Ochrovirga pacifica TaxID=1042376 RepID=UPI0002557B80|nr:aldehyde dehydrogenase family protein [Ochrovirga pacifica]
MIKTYNPYTQKELEQYPTLSESEIDDKLVLIEQSYRFWKASDISYRQKLGNIFEKIVLENKESLAKMITLEMGKPYKESIAEIEKCATLVRYFTNHFSQFLQDQPKNESSYISYQPQGAVFGIMPWNFPFWQVFRYAFPNIMAGNVCVLKHASNVTGCALELEKLFLKAGFPSNVFTALVIDSSQVEQVIQHDCIQGVCVTGSNKAGSAVAALAGKHLKKSVLELGGTDAFAILDDANLEDALSAAFTSRLKNTGQVCIAAKRIFVPKTKISQATDFLLEKMEHLVLGDPMNENVNMGPIAKEEFLETLQEQVEKTIQHGAKLIKGGKVNAPFYSPTLLVVEKDNPLLKEEIFGPVLCLIGYEKESELIDQVNNSPYGLGAAVWTKDLEKANKLAKQIESGYVAINNLVVSDPKLPFGGVKNSGYGKELGEDGFYTFLNKKTIVIS